MSDGCRKLMLIAASSVEAAAYQHAAGRRDITFVAMAIRFDIAASIYIALPFSPEFSRRGFTFCRAIRSMPFSRCSSSDSLQIAISARVTSRRCRQAERPPDAALFVFSSLSAPRGDDSQDEIASRSRMPVTPLCDTLPQRLRSKNYAALRSPLDAMLD